MTGYLELFKLAGPIFFNSFVTFGLLLYFCYLIHFLSENKFFIANFINKLKSPLKFFFGGVISLVLIAITINYSLNLPLNTHDDFNGYLILTQRILQEGHQGADPFNDHSIEQGFGAGNFFLALFANFINISDLHIVDIGVGLILLFLIFMKLIKIQSKVLIISLLLVIFINSPIVNLTPLLIACGIYLISINFFIQSNYANKLIDYIALSLLLSCLLLLKGNYILPVMALSTCIFLTRIRGNGFKKSILEILLFSFLMILFTAPWMISNFRFSDTAFYPILGHGLVSPNALTLATGTQYFETALNLIPTYALLIALLSNIFASKNKANYHLTFFLSTLVLITITLSICLNLTSAGLFTRYYFVLFFGPVAFLSIYVINNYYSQKIYLKNYREHILEYFILFIILVIFIPTFAKAIKYTTKQLNKSIFEHMSYDFSDDYLRITSLQNKIPIGSKILFRLDMPFLGNFKTHNISVMDWPGNSGPYPGVPFTYEAESLAQYLRAQGIMYILYSYKNEALFSRKNPELFSRINHPNPWIRSQAIRTFAVQDQLESLSKTYRIVYDNGQDFVLDLNTTVQ
jgi:hypothetical protein